MGRQVPTGSFDSQLEELGKSSLYSEVDGAIYALPEALIDELQDNAFGDRFFSRAEERFERQLTAVVGTGASFGKRVDFSLLTSDAANRESAEMDATDQRIKSMMVEDMADRGLTESEIREYFETRKEFEESVHENQMGYAGWLVTNGTFRAELQCLRGQLTIRRHRLLPQLSKYIFSHPVRTIETKNPEIAGWLEMFCRRWAIDSMVTWHLPLPIAPHFGTSLYKIDELEPAGLTIFLPWSIARAFKLKTQQIQELQKMTAAPSHLAEWIDGRPKEFGVARYAMMLRLFVSLELVLRVRYKEKIDGKLEQFESAFARFAGCSTDSIRKVRLRMDQRLRNEQDPSVDDSS